MPATVPLRFDSRDQRGIRYPKARIRAMGNEEENGMCLRSAKIIASVSVVALVMIGCGGSASPLAAAASSRSAPLVLVRFRVPSASMLPTLKVGSEVTVNLDAYHAVQPRTGDITVFHPPRGAEPGASRCGVAGEGEGSRKPCAVPTPQESREKFIKRVVGLPGDRISIVGGHVIRNGAREKGSYIKRCGEGGFCNFRTPITVAPGDYFMMGDNRGASDDSRFWGPVRRSWILGKVIGR